MFLQSVTQATLRRFSRCVLFFARHPLINFLLSERQALFK